MTGLARAAQAITNGLPVNDQCCPRSYQHSNDLQVGTAVAEFVTFCQSPLPMPEDWLLLDGQIPKGTLVSVGGYSLKSATAKDLRQSLYSGGDENGSPAERAHALPACRSGNPWSRLLLEHASCPK